MLCILHSVCTVATNVRYCVINAAITKSCFKDWCVYVRSSTSCSRAFWSMRYARNTPSTRGATSTSSNEHSLTSIRTTHDAETLLSRHRHYRATTPAACWRSNVCLIDRLPLRCIAIMVALAAQSLTVNDVLIRRNRWVTSAGVTSCRYSLYIQYLPSVISRWMLLTSIYVSRDKSDENTILTLTKSEWSFQITKIIFVCSGILV